MPKRRRSLVRWIVLGAVGVVVLAAAGPFVFIHFIEGAAPAKLTLPTGTTGTTAVVGRGAASSTTAGGTGSTTTAAGAASGELAEAVPVAGTWAVGSGSVVGYRVQEVLVGQQSTAVGRTSKVWGSLTISGGSVTKGSFTADMASVVSDQPQRNAQFDGRIMDVSAYPTASFTLTKPIALGSLPSDGQTKSFVAAGDLTMHGVTKPVTFTLEAERLRAGIYVLADIHILFANWDIANPSFAGLVTTRDYGTLEILLHLTKGVGNPAVKTSSSTTGGGFAGAPGGPPTVPSTTVPPLSVPKS
jgi:polyisoprenoid-binding protein YceI